MIERETVHGHRVEWFVVGDCPHCGPLLEAVEARCRELPLEFQRVPVLSALDRAVALDGRLLMQGAFAPRKAVQCLRAELETLHANR